MEYYPFNNKYLKKIKYILPKPFILKASKRSEILPCLEVDTLARFSFMDTG